MKFRNKIAFILFVIITVTCFSHCKLILYGIEQGTGQIKMVYQAVPINDVLANPDFPDSLKAKLRLVTEIKKFAIDSIGLNESENYTKVYDQKGKPILWVVTASPKYEIKSYLWSFPIVGSLPYKGFFSESDAKKEEEKLITEGFDTRVGNVSAWSTLGFFRDPILSNMLFRSEGELAELIIHELTHATIFIKGNAQFNENLATLIGNEGAKYFLKSKFGANSEQLKEYIGMDADDRNFARHILRGSIQLDSLYASFQNNFSVQEKDSFKKNMISRIFSALDTINFYDKSLAKRFLKRKTNLNNAFFINYKTYHEDMNVFQKEFIQNFNSDFRKYLVYLKNKYAKEKV